MGPVARALRAGCRGWQRLRAGQPSPCRFHPSCSQYAIEALEAHGAPHGAWLATRRILRCNPWGPYGYDPVPLPSTAPRSETERSAPQPASPA
jgi:putative membrane protein insertion efficiency factor